MKAIYTLLAVLLFMLAGSANADDVCKTATMTMDSDGNITITASNLPQIPMKKVEGGTFEMGAESSQGQDIEEDELPAHKVSVSTFAIGRYEVTQELWMAVMGSNPCDPGEDPQTPVYNVSWQAVQEFLSKLNAHPAIRQAGHTFRLPTEAEWEFAARGGRNSKGFRYAGSNDLDEVAWYKVNSRSDVHPVGQKKPNELNLFDMSGNVFEWCNDWYSASFYELLINENPTGPTSGTARVVRGGAWGVDANQCRVAYRATYSPTGEGVNILGLRLAMTLPDDPQ